DRPVLLEHGHYHRRSGHELNELSEERTLPMHLVEAFGFRPREVPHAKGEHSKAAFLDARQNRPGLSLLDGVGLDDAEGAFDGHGCCLYSGWSGELALAS